MVWTNIEYRGRSFALSGDGGDPYFAGISGWAGASGALLHYLERLTPWPGSTCFDVGANIGLTACLLSKAMSHGSVYAFEPSPAAWPHLRNTVERNGLSNVTPVNLALGAGEGRVAFMDGPGSSSASHLTEGSIDQPTDVVEMTTVDAFMFNRRLSRLDFLKIDVEGFEIPVLEGARHSIADHRPMAVIEFNSFTLSAYGNINPRTAIERICSIFPYVYRWHNGLHRIQGAEDMRLFLHANLTQNSCVDDLLCAWSELAR
jgi:FkbM family methyltransferase